MEKEREREMMKADHDDEDGVGVVGDARNKNVNESIPPPLSMVVRRLLYDGRLSDQCWNSEDEVVGD